MDIEVQPGKFGEPSDEEMAAIIAAIETSLMSGNLGSAKPRTPVWRFSNRWWS